jgi:hypothetical protein
VSRKMGNGAAVDDVVAVVNLRLVDGRTGQAGGGWAGFF